MDKLLCISLAGSKKLNLVFNSLLFTKCCLNILANIFILSLFFSSFFETSILYELAIVVNALKLFA